MDISLWRPYATRKVKPFTPDDPVDMIRKRRVNYVVVGGLHRAIENKTLKSWSQETGGELVGTVSAVVKVSEGHSRGRSRRFRDRASQGRVRPVQGLMN
jgi:hypothetical protein